MSERDAEEPRLVRRLRRQRRRYEERGRLYRAIWVTAGITIVAAGLAMIVFPGPAFVAIPIGLAMLALEFAWAERLLERALVQADEAKRKAERASTAQRVLTGLAVAAGVAAFVVCAVLYDIPVLPV
jgi:uncharacterized protein (TIGR02611 family)